MRLIACLVSLGLLSAGCALQTGDPSAESTGRPEEVVAAPGNGATGREVLPTSFNPEQLDPTPPAAARPSGSSAHGAAAATPAATSTAPTPPPGGPAGDNPNPSPWIQNAGGIVFQGPAPKGDGS